MKRIEAIIRPEKVNEVKDSLTELGLAGLTIYDVKGHGTQKGISQQWRGQEYSVDLLPKTSVVMVVHDHEVQDIVDVISRVARTGPYRRRQDLRHPGRAAHGSPHPHGRDDPGCEAL